MPDGDDVALKVDGVPSQAQSLAAPQPVEGGNLDQQRIRVILRRLKELLQLLQTVVIRDRNSGITDRLIADSENLRGNKILFFLLWFALTISSLNVSARKRLVLFLMK